MNSEKTVKALEKFSEVGIIPVVVLNDAKNAEPLGKALMEGGLPAAEVTFRTEAAEESIRIMAEKFPDMLVGAGTVLTIEQVDRAVAAGAKFIVSPGFDADIVKYCLEKDIPVCPGIQTPTELIQAVKLGAGEIVLNSMDADGTRAGYELNLTRMISDAVSVPVVASGGGGTRLYEGRPDYDRTDGKVG